MRHNHPDEHDKEVLVEQVRFLYRNATRSIPFNIGVPSILVLVFWTVTTHATLIYWFAAMTGVSLVRLLHVHKVLRRDRFASEPEVLSRHFVIGSSATAVLWSAGFVTIGFSLPPVYLILFLLVIGGIAAGSFTSMGTHRAGYLVFLALLYVPVLVKLAVSGTPLVGAITVVVIIFAVMLALTHGVSYRMLINGIQDRIENAQLVKRLERANNRLEIANIELGTRAETDSLTSIGNRRFFEQRFTVEWRRARRHGTSIACIMIDVDHFKQFNDHYGHTAGDDCLKRIARALNANIKRATDIVARYGGEEFIVLLPDTSRDGALSVAERLRTAIIGLSIPHEGAPDIQHVSISLGVACATPDRQYKRHAVVTAADEALYTAKKRGRNCVVAYEYDAVTS